jgi:hypothetical protein
MPQIVEAGVITIWPHEFRLHNYPGSSTAESEYHFYRSPTFISGFSVDACYLFAPVKLPVGKKVTKLKCFISGTDADAATSVSLRCLKMGRLPTEMAFVFASGVSDTYAESDTSIYNAEVTRNYLYYVTIYVDNEFSRIHGVKVYYK